MNAIVIPVLAVSAAWWLWRDKIVDLYMDLFYPVVTPRLQKIRSFRNRDRAFRQPLTWGEWKAELMVCYREWGEDFFGKKGPLRNGCLVSWREAWEDGQDPEWALENELDAMRDG